MRRVLFVNYDYDYRYCCTRLSCCEQEVAFLN